MKLEKCKICNEWIDKKKIAMHYWNVHKEKYSNFKEGAEIKEIEDEPKVEVEDEKTEHREVQAGVQEKTVETVTEPRRTETRKTGEEKKAVRTGERRTGASTIVDFGLEHTGWSNSWVEDDIEGATINEWC